MLARGTAAASFAALVALSFAPRSARAQAADADAAAPDAAPADAAVADAPAPAPSPAGDDVLALRDGTTLRGHATDVRVGDHATIALASGEVRTVDWRAIASADGPAFEHGVAVAPLPTPPPVPAVVDNRPAHGDFARPGAGRVPLRVESEGPVPQRVGVTLSLEAQGTGFESHLQMNHRTFCTTPCTLFVPPGPFALYTSGRGIVETTTQLEVPPAGLSARVFAPSVGVDSVATAVLTVAAVAAVVGVVMLATTFSAAGPPDALEFTSLGMIIGGAALLPLGLILVATNHRGVQSLRRGVATHTE